MTSAPSGSTRVPAAERRAEIVRAAQQLFAQKGYDGTSIEDIGAAVGLTGPAIYRHFDSKQALFVATFRSADETTEDALSIAVNQAPRDAMTTVMRAEAIIAVHDRDALIIWLRERNRMPRQTLLENTDRRNRLYNLMERCLKEIRPDLAHGQITELRNLVTSVALGAADQTSALDAEDRIDFMVSAGWTMIERIELA